MSLAIPPFPADYMSSAISPLPADDMISAIPPFPTDDMTSVVPPFPKNDMASILPPFPALPVFPESSFPEFPDISCPALPERSLGQSLSTDCGEKFSFPAFPAALSPLIFPQFPDLPEIYAEPSHIPPFSNMDVDDPPTFPTFPHFDAEKCPSESTQAEPCLTFPDFPDTLQQEMTEAEPPRMTEAYPPFPAFPNTWERESQRTVADGHSPFPAFPDCGRLTSPESSAGRTKEGGATSTHRRLGDKRHIHAQLLEVCLL